MAKKKVVKSPVANVMSVKGVAPASAGALAILGAVVVDWVSTTWFHTPIPADVQVALAGLAAPFVWMALPDGWEA